MTAIRTFFQDFWNRIPQIGVNDIIDILIVAFLFYTLMRLIRSTSAARIARSILLHAQLDLEQDFRDRRDRPCYHVPAGAAADVRTLRRQVLYEPHQQRHNADSGAAGH